MPLKLSFFFSPRPLLLYLSISHFQGKFQNHPTPYTCQKPISLIHHWHVLQCVTAPQNPSCEPYTNTHQQHTTFTLQDSVLLVDCSEIKTSKYQFLDDCKMAVKTNEFVEGCLPEELEKLLLSLASKWGDTIDDPNTVHVTPLKGAMTNKVYQISWPIETGIRKVLLRMYGKGVDIFFNRDDEIRTFESLSKHGYGPLLLGRFPEGRVEEFIHAKTLSADDLRDPEVSALVAAKLREFHNLDMPGPKNVFLWDRMRNWLPEAKFLCSTEDAEEFCLASLQEEISMLEEEFSRDCQDIGFCHNDLQYGNIMIDEVTRSITIIDYEYASYNPVAYDLANHFCEMAANYHTETPHILDYTKYPDLKERQRFVHNYMSSSGKKPSDTEVEQLIQDVEEYTLANHLFWGLWGIISSRVNKIDFDYKEYARQRFQQYWLRKQELLGSTGVPAETT